MDQFRRIYKDLWAQWLIKMHKISVLRMETPSENEPIITINFLPIKTKVGVFFFLLSLVVGLQTIDHRLYFPGFNFNGVFIFCKTTTMHQMTAPVADITV